MAEVSDLPSCYLSDPSDHEESNVGRMPLKQRINKIRESHRICHERRKQEKTKVTKWRDKCRDHYEKKLRQLEKDRKQWHQTLVQRRREMSVSEREMRERFERDHKLALYDLQKEKEYYQQKLVEMDEQMSNIQYQTRERIELDYRLTFQDFQAELDAWQQKAADQDAAMHILKKEMTAVKKKLKQQRLELRVTSDQLKSMGHFLCDICCDRQKSRVTFCGHGFCEICLDHWLFTTSGQAASNNGQPSIVERGTCPTCRQVLHRQTDIWPLYLPESAE